MELGKTLKLSELPTRQVIAIFRQIRAAMPGYIAASLVDLHTGTTSAVHAARGDFDLAAASALNSELVKLENKALSALESRAKLADIMVVLSHQIHFIRVVDSGAAFVFLATDRKATNVAIVRAAVAKHLAGWLR